MRGFAADWFILNQGSKLRWMRQSRQSSVLSQVDRLKYPKCDKKKEHSKQSLNYICLTAHCKSRGLLCVQCKGAPEHAGHNIQPLRVFISKMEEALKKSESLRNLRQQEKQQDKGQRTLLDRLEEAQLELLSTLKIQIEEVSRKIQVCEEEILAEFARTRERISAEFEKQTLISRSLEDIHSFLTEEKEKEHHQNDLRLFVSRLLSLIKIEKSDYSIENLGELHFKAYSLAAKSFKTNMLIWERQTNNILGEVFKIKPEYQEKEVKMRPTTAGESTSKPGSIAFSAAFKTDSIQLLSEGKIAKVKDDKAGKVILLSERVMEWKNTPIKIKIVTLSPASSMHVGLCLKSLIIQKHYKFEKNNPSHGCFLGSSMGFVYSNNDEAVNNTKWSLGFRMGDELTIQADHKQSRLSLRKKNDSKNYLISLKHLSEADWQDLFFCISFTAKDDKVQIVG